MARRSVDKDFFETAEDWSRRKHLILSYYLKPAIAKMRTQSSQQRVVVLDGYAGAGKYQDGTPGSPAHLGMLAEECQKWQSPAKLALYNTEPNPTTFQSLEANTQEWVSKGYMENLLTTFQEALPTILKKYPNDPLFAFLDPFAPTQLGFDDMLPLLRRDKATELCIIFHTPSVVRLLGTVREGAGTDTSTRQANQENLNVIFQGDVWQAIIRDLKPEENISPESVVACFAKQVLKNTNWYNVYVGSHGVNARYGVGLKYHVVFVTRHEDGIELMNDAFCQETKAAFAESTSQTALDLGFETAERQQFPSAELTEEQRKAELRDALLVLGRENPKRVWKRPELIFASIEARFGDFSRSEHLQAIQALVDTGGIPRLNVKAGGRQTKAGKWILNDATELQFQF